MGGGVIQTKCVCVCVRTHVLVQGAWWEMTTALPAERGTHLFCCGKIHMTKFTILAILNYRHPPTF